jgi:spore coat protein U-like protein
VKAQVDPSCTVALTAQNTVLAFGTLNATPALMVAQADATGSITISCASGVNYSVVAGDGRNYSSGWRMDNGSGQYLSYQLYSDAARSTAFARAGTSLSYQGFQNLTIHGRVPAQTVGGTGTFTDSVSFTVTY